MKFVPCGKCNNGYYYQEECSKAFIAIECECHKKWQHQNTVEKTYKHNGFDMRHFTYSPRQYVGTKSLADKDRIINYVSQFELNPKVRSLICYLYGPNGTQKTTMMSWVGKSLIDKGFSVRYMLMNDLVKTLIDAEGFEVERSEKAKAKVEKLEETDLIIIDEAFDKDKMKLWRSGYQLSFIDSWIRRRVGTLNKGIFFISNVEIQNIEANGLSHSIQDFVEREVKINNCYLKFEDNFLKCSTKEFTGSLF